MNTKTTLSIISIAIAIVIALFGAAAYEMMKGADEVMENTNSESMMNSKTDTMMKKEGAYVAYDSSAIAAAATTGQAVLFFHAPWCPTCSALNKDIEGSLSDIPAGLTIFKTDYDSNTELKKKYGVTYQHTLVQVDKNGAMIKKWSGGNTLESVVSQVQ